MRTMMDMRMKPENVRWLLGQLDAPFTGEVVFDHFHDTVFFIKNAMGQYLVVNETLVHRCGLKRKSQLIGRTPEEVLIAPLGSSFAQQDRQLLDSGHPLTGQLELHIYPSADVGWCITNKHPLTDNGGRIVGLVGVSRDLGSPRQDGGDYESIVQVVDYVRNNLSRPIKVQELVELSDLSRFQLDRRMQIAFGLTAGQWLLKSRIDLARTQLQSTSEPIVNIAHNAGYSDQSAFSRQFRRVTGLTPNEYRRIRRKAD